MRRQLYAALLGICLTTALSAGEVKVLGVQFNQANGHWTVHTTLEHDDSGWEHYADAWRVVDSKGKVLGTRTLYHPHENEQPFTRSLSGIEIPKAVTTVFVEAHDKVHGWSIDRVKVDLRQASGERFQVGR